LQIILESRRPRGNALISEYVTQSISPSFCFSKFFHKRELLEVVPGPPVYHGKYDPYHPKTNGYGRNDVRACDHYNRAIGQLGMTGREDDRVYQQEQEFNSEARSGKRAGFLREVGSNGTGEGRDFRRTDTA
jgi:hypothetical protein